MPPKSKKKKKKIVKIDEHVTSIDTDTFFDLVVLPPDGGWGWFVVFGSFITNLTVDGTTYLFGMFLSDIVTTMKCTETKVTTSSSMLTGIYFISGIVHFENVRLTGLIGAVISTGGLVAASLSPDWIYFLISYGIVCGLSFAMCCISSILAVNFYFERWRAVAVGISVSGSSVGTVIVPPIFSMYLKDLTWRAKYQILAAMVFVNVFISLINKPIIPYAMEREHERKSEEDKVSVLSYPVSEDNPKSIFYKKHNAAYPTNAEILPNALQTGSGSVAGRSLSKSSFKRGDWSSISVTGKKYRECTCGRCNCKIKRCCCIADTLQKPMYKDDILYTGSISTLPTFDSTIREKGRASLEYNMSVTRTSTIRDLQQSERCCVCCPEAVVRTLATMLDFSLMKSSAFVLLLFSGFFTYLGISIPYVYIIDFSKSRGFTTEKATLLVSTMGISNGVGRLVTGLATLYPKANALLITIISLFLAGISTVAVVYAHHRYLFYAYAATYGASIACMPSLRPIIAVEMLGLEKLSNSYGLIVLFMGFSSFAGLPIASEIREYTNSYNMPLIFAGGSIIISVVLLLPIKPLIRKGIRKAEEREQKERKRKLEDTRKRLAEINKPKSTQPKAPQPKAPQPKSPQPKAPQPKQPQQN